jgi:hypothetical protein
VLYFSLAMSGFSLLNSGKTVQSGMRQPTTHVSPPSDHCAPCAVPVIKKKEAEGALSDKKTLCVNTCYNTYRSGR